MKKVSNRSKKFIKLGFIGVLAVLVAVTVAFAVNGFVKDKAVYAEKYEEVYKPSQTDYVIEEQNYTRYTIEDAEWNEYSEGQLNDLQRFTNDVNRKNELVRKTQGLSLGGKDMDSWDEDIFHYIPETVLIRPGKSAFIGQEYGRDFSTSSN